MIDRLLDVATVARRLGVADETVRRWIRQGQLPEAHRSFTGRLKIPASVLVRLEKSHNTHTTSS